MGQEAQPAGSFVRVPRAARPEWMNVAAGSRLPRVATNELLDEMIEQVVRDVGRGWKSTKIAQRSWIGLGLNVARTQQPQCERGRERACDWATRECIESGQQVM